MSNEKPNYLAGCKSIIVKEKNNGFEIEMIQNDAEEDIEARLWSDVFDCYEEGMLEDN